MTAGPEIPTVALYAGLNALIFLWLTAHVGFTRRRLRIPLGDDGDMTMLRAMRGQANFVEYVPLALILLGLMAAMGTPVWVLHLFGILLTLSRVFHALHFTAPEAPGWSRSAGAGITILLLVLAAFGVTGHALWAMVAA